MATGGQFYWPSVGIFVAAYGQFFMAANRCAARSQVSAAILQFQYRVFVLAEQRPGRFSPGCHTVAEAPIPLSALAGTPFLFQKHSREMADVPSPAKRYCGFNESETKGLSLLGGRWIGSRLLCGAGYWIARVLASPGC
ncbi:hypothetical protein GCM10023063_41270 [Arthrobacter methylotrophus]